MAVEHEPSGGALQFALDDTDNPVALTSTTDSSGKNVGRVIPVDIPMDAKGNYPATWYLETSGSAAATDDILLFTVTDTSMYNIHMFQCSDGAVDIEVSLDGTTFTDAVAIQAIDNAQTAVVFVAVTAGTDVFILRGKYKAIRVRNTAAATATCVMASGVE